MVEVGNVADATAKTKCRKWTTIARYDGSMFTAPMGQFRPNAFGLYDMHGNVWEWCSDEYSADYYQQSPASDQRRPGQASRPVIRGRS